MPEQSRAEQPRPQQSRPQRPRRPGATPTIYDVAREASVAASTVSRTFSRPGRVSPETAEHVRQVAARLGYRTNPLARALPTGRTSMIAVVVSDITNPYYFEIIRGAQSAAAEAGFTMLLADTQESDQLEREALERALPTVEGIVLGSTRMTDSAIRMTAKQRPMVVLNRAVTDVPSVSTDNARGMRRAVEHLAELGHESFTYVAGPQASWADGMRWRSMRDSTHQLDLRARRVGPYPPTVQGGVEAVADLARHQPSAVVAYNDLQAIGILRGLQQIGVKVPRDVSVVGFDDIFGSDLVTPGLTTVAAPTWHLGEAAVRHVLAVAREGRSPSQASVVLPTRLVVRQSTGRRTRRRAPTGWGATAGPDARRGPPQS